MNVDTNYALAENVAATQVRRQIPALQRMGYTVASWWDLRTLSTILKHRWLSPTGVNVTVLQALSDENGHDSTYVLGKDDVEDLRQAVQFAAKLPAGVFQRVTITTKPIYCHGWSVTYASGFLEYGDIIGGGPEHAHVAWDASIAQAKTQFERARGKK